MELIDRVKKDIDRRLEELRPQVEEIPRLEAALTALDASGGGRGQVRRSARAASRTRGRPRGSAGASARRRGGAPRRRARRGQRREELLQLVAGNPEITIAEAARTMGVSSPQVSVLVRRLEEEGVLERSDGRFVPIAPAPEEIQGPGVESIAGEEGVAAAESVPERARDEAGRPPAS